MKMAQQRDMMQLRREKIKQEEAREAREAAERERREKREEDRIQREHEREERSAARQLEMQKFMMEMLGAVGGKRKRDDMGN